MVVVVDSKEPAKMRELLRNEKVPTVVEDIEFCDYLVKVGDYSIPVERKTASDFVASIEDGRIFLQAYMMSTVSPIGFIVVEGSPVIVLMERRFPRQAYIGALSSLALKRSPYGERGQISVIVVDTEYDTVLFLKYLHRQLEEGKLHRLPKLNIRGKRLLDKRGVLVAMLQAIPGVGEERARRLAERFGSVERLVRASVAEIASVEGVGTQLARRIKEYLS